MKNIVLNYNNVDEAVSTMQDAGVNVRWSGWDMVFLKEMTGTDRSRAGRFQNGKWGFPKTISPNAQGNWVVPRDYVSA